MTAGAVSAPLIIPIIPLQTHRSKNHIDTNTPVSIQSDTPGVLIFYTLDGSKPAAGQRGSACSSRKYLEPILLPAGRVSVRAVAVCSDGRESATVTKVFSVHSVNVLQSEQQHLSEGTSWTSAGSPLRRPEPRTMGNSSSPSAPRFPNSRPGSATTASKSGTSQSDLFQTVGVFDQLNSTEVSRIQRETDFMRCAKCLSLRPSDPFARFCAQCGAVVSPLPDQRLPPAEGGQTIRCVFCKTLVPVNTETCLICEASVHQQLRPQATRTLQDHVVCVCCGVGNPAHVSRCLSCETDLQMVGDFGDSAPPGLSEDIRMLSCSRCERMNRSDARFCDWCGSKVDTKQPGSAARSVARSVVCWRCGASGHQYAFYCTACGVHLDAPARPTTRNDIVRPVRASISKQASTLTCHNASWKAPNSTDYTPNVKVSLHTENQSTQTVGLYFPSATELHRRQQEKEVELSKQKASRDRQPLLTAISPGRGYWRKQLDHVCAHLRSYTQNNPSFRTVLGEPRLGRVVSAVIHEDQYEICLTVSFVSAGREGQQVGPECEIAVPAGEAPRTETLSRVTEKTADPSRSDPSPRLMKSLEPNLTTKPPIKNIQLLNELGPGRGRISVIQRLLDQGADPTCCDGDGRHTLLIAVRNCHHDVLPVLLRCGADIDHQSGRTKNTALHEAAALGFEGLQCAQALLSCKASVRRRNAAGQTPYDVAVNSGCNDLVSLLAAQTGLDLLGKLGQPKLNLDIF